MPVDHSELLARGVEIETRDGRADLQQIDREGIIHEDLDHLTALEADEEASRPDGPPVTLM